ncbi:MAG: hypothetical protein ACOY93_06465 [Bacillota bacterium]
MKRAVLAALVVAAMVLSVGCSKKDTEKEDLRSQVAALQEQVTKLEKERNDLKSQLDQVTLKSTDEQRQAEDLQKALEVRLLHHPLTEFTIEPAVITESGWLMVDGEHTYKLAGHSGASKVVFFWAEAGNDFRPQQLGEDTNGANGWSWTGSLPFGNQRAFWAEIHYPGGVKVMSGVLPLRSSGK